MTRPVVWLALVASMGCNAETQEQTDLNSQRISSLEEELAALQERVLAAEGGIQANNTSIAAVGVDATEALQGVAENTAAIDALVVRVDGHDLAVAEASGAIASLDSRLFDPTYGEVVLLQSEVAAAQLTLADHQAAIDGNAAAIAANAAAVVDLATTVSGLEATVALHDVELADQAVALTDLQLDVDAMTSDVTALEATVAGHDASLLALQTSVSDLEATDASHDAALAALQAKDAAHDTAIAGLQSKDATHDAAIAGLQSTSGAHDAAIAALEADVAAIETNIVGPVEDLLIYLSADTNTDTVNISGADLAVDGRIFGEDLTFRQCPGGQYQCTPRACLDLCAANGERMATVEEALIWASRKQDKCQWQWMLDRDNPAIPVRGFPMYFNRTTGGCGAINTGDVPRVVGPLLGTGWDDTTLASCACAAL